MRALIIAEGASLVVSAPAGQPTEPVTVDLGSGRSLRAHMTDSDGTLLRVTLWQPPPDPDAQIDREPVSESGPTSVTVVASAGGVEVGRATFAPSYRPYFPWGDSCPFYAGGAATLQLTEAP